MNPRAFTVCTAPQRSAEWFAARAGRLTGSAAGDMLATIKSKGEAASRRNLRARLVCERLTGRPIEDGDGFQTAAMRRGVELEPEAIKAYESQTGNLVRRTGFLAHDGLPVGCSLDGDVDDFAGIVEVKCPNSATHLDYLKARTLPADYHAQILHNLWITGAAWADFVSYDDRFPRHLRTLVVRVEVTAFDLMAYEKAVLRFLDEVDAELSALQAPAEVA